MSGTVSAESILYRKADEHTHFRWTKDFANEHAIPLFLTKTGDFLQPGLRKILASCLTVVSSTLAGVLSILVMMTTTGTLRARDTDRCSLLIPDICARG